MRRVRAGRGGVSSKREDPAMDSGVCMVASADLRPADPIRSDVRTKSHYKPRKSIKFANIIKYP